MKRKIWGVLLVAGLILGGCEKESGPDASGEIVLSSETFLSSSYYLYGYNYEDSQMQEYPSPEASLPDIINEGFRVMVDGKKRSLPGFSTPGQVNGFALLGEFGSASEARTFYEDYTEVKLPLMFTPFSDTVRLHQVWLQSTQAGKYAKLLVSEIREFENDAGSVFNEVRLDFTYQSNGSTSFPD